MIKWILTKIVGSKNQREVRKLRPIVASINAIEEKLQAQPETVLQEKTREWQAYLHRFLPMDLPPKRVVEEADEETLKELSKRLQDRFDALRPDFPSLPQTIQSTPEDIEKGKALFNDLFDDFFKMRERYLHRILPEAFAVVKNAARRLCGTEVEVMGHTQTWDMVPFDVQLLGGIALHKGFIAEMATGEGKTLVATLPVYLNALTGLGVHVITVNDYLAGRDSTWMGTLYRYLGLTVGCIQSQMPPQYRREQYSCDITYGTNSEFGFDYLRDNGMASSRDEQVQRTHYFAIIDEVDSILIDEARTPLIISGPAVIKREQQFDTLKPAIERVVRAQNELCNDLMAEGMHLLEEGKTEGAGRIFYKVKLAQPRNRAYLRMMEEPENRRLVEKAELTLYQDPQKKELFKLKEELFYTVDEKTHDADLMSKGREVISPGAPEAFVLPDIGTEFAKLDNNEHLSAHEIATKKKEWQAKLDEVGERLHTTSQLLKAYCLYEKDVEYVLRDNKVVIVDQHTGREMPGRRWSDGLHQAVEAKEGVEVEAENQTYATITIQNYFRLYQKLAGMTGTAETEAAEFHDIYKLDVLPIPTNKPCLREDSNDLIYKTRREKLNAVIARIKELHAKGQPILIGTASVEASETLSRMLKRAGIDHEVLNAKNHQREAEIVSMAGQMNAVTVSTNMAGRGTDIKLGKGVADVGGLFVLGTERHESRRIDRQLRGRCSRQGDPGASQFFLSFEDDLMRNFGAAERMTRLMERFGMQDGEAIEHGLMNRSVEQAQKRVEQRYYINRKRVLEFDDVMNKQREVVYGYRNETLITENPTSLIYEAIEEYIPQQVDKYMGVGQHALPDPEDLVEWLNRSFPISATTDMCMKYQGDNKGLSEFLIKRVKELYDRKSEGERAEYLDRMERQIILSSIDKNWQAHLYNMDALRDGVYLRAQGQKDPLVEYKTEAYKLFEGLMDTITKDIVEGLFRTTTNIDAFEEFLRSLPTNMSDILRQAPLEDEDTTDDEVQDFPLNGPVYLPTPEGVEAPVYHNRDQMPDPENLALSASLSQGEGDLGVVEKPMVLPKRKVFSFDNNKADK